MKGISLPINITIILVISIIVLIAIIALFMGVWGQSSYGISIDAAKNSGCQRYISLDYCTSTPIDADIKAITINTVTCGEDEVGNLYDLADKCFGGKIADEICCS